MKTYIFIANFSEAAEALIPYDLLSRAGIYTKFVSINKNKITKMANGCEFIADYSIDEAEFDDADAIILPGGLIGVENLKNSEKLSNIIRFYNHEKKYVCAICAAPTILEDMGILQNKKATCYTSMSDCLKSCNFVDDEVVVDENIVTSRGLGASFSFALKIIELLISKEESDKVGNATLIK